MATTLHFDARDAIRGLKALRTRAPYAVARAINRSVTTVRAAAAREISADLGIRVGVVKEQLVVDSATPQRPVATITASGRRIPLIDLDARGPEPSRGRGRGVSYRIGGVRRRLPHAFIAQMRSGHRGVFKRTRTKRLPIVELHGPSLARVFAKDAIVKAVQARYEEAMTKNLPHEIEFELRRLGARSA